MSSKSIASFTKTSFTPSRLIGENEIHINAFKHQFITDKVQTFLNEHLIDSVVWNNDNESIKITEFLETNSLVAKFFPVFDCDQDNQLKMFRTSLLDGEIHVGIQHSTSDSEEPKNGTFSGIVGFQVDPLKENKFSLPDIEPVSLKLESIKDSDFKDEFAESLKSNMEKLLLECQTMFEEDESSLLETPECDDDEILLKFVCVSDTHTYMGQVDVPEGDILLHAGDFSYKGTDSQVEQFNEDLGALPHPLKLVIAGNHDIGLEERASETEPMLTNCEYLRDEEFQVNGLRVWGSPWQPWFFDWAFNLQRGEEIRMVWDLIPEGIDVLMTHGPPQGHGDLCTSGDRAGCEEMLKVTEALNIKYSVFGHIHEGYGVTWNEQDQVFINPSSVDFRYRTGQKPIVFWMKAKKDGNTGRIPLTEEQQIQLDKFEQAYGRTRYGGKIEKPEKKSFLKKMLGKQ